MDQRIASLWLIVFFAMVWLPLGQQDFMVEHWMKIGAYVAPILLFMGFKQRAGSDARIFTDVALMACVFAASYLCHQIEEHWVDLLGREYPLYDYLNSVIAGALGDDKYGVMTPSAIFYVNAGTVWTIALVSILAAPRHVFPVIAMAGLILVNGVAHIIAALVGFEYNSGLATSIVLFVPLSVLFFRALLASGQASPGRIGAGILWGFGGHVFLFGGLFAANIYGLFPVVIYYGLLIAYGALPIVLFRPARLAAT
ncbi:MAG: HXXEE domain-containing protein [Pseudomonadota bacterium]